MLLRFLHANVTILENNVPAIMFPGLRSPLRLVFLAAANFSDLGFQDLATFNLAISSDARLA